MIHPLTSMFKQYVLPKRLLTRFVLIILLPMVILQIMVAIYFYHKHWDTISRRLADDVIGEIELVADWTTLQSDPSAGLKKLSSRLGMNFEWTTHATLPATKMRKDISATTLRSKIKDNMSYPSKSLTQKSGEQIVYVQLDQGLLTVTVPQKRFFSTTVPSFLLWTVGSSFLLFWIAFIFMKNQVRAMVRLAKAAELFGLGQEIKFKPQGAEEVRQAGQAFIEMKERLGRYLMERTTMLAGVSHDLRTPLTRIKLTLSMMEPDDATKMINQDITEMEHMLTGYLDFAKGLGKEPMETMEITPFFNTIINNFKRTGYEISLHIEENARLRARPHELARAFSNLISNAQHYASITRVNIGCRQNDIQITIDDNGPGIPAKKRADVFKPFYRVDPSRNKNTGGVGLGMTITRDIILAHGGSIKLETSPMKGLRVVVILPKK